MTDKYQLCLASTRKWPVGGINGLLVSTLFVFNWEGTSKGNEMAAQC